VSALFVVWLHPLVDILPQLIHNSAVEREGQPFGCAMDSINCKLNKKGDTMMERVRFRIAMALLAAIMIAAAVLGSAGPAQASLFTVKSCKDVFYYMKQCLQWYPNNQAMYESCLDLVYTSANYYGVNVEACFEGCSEDGRVNQNCSAPEIVYCDEDTVDFYAYNYFTLEGDYDFKIATADLLKSVSVRKLIKQDGAVKVFLNVNGTVMVLAPQTDGKIYFLVFDPMSCAPMNEGAEWGVK